MKRFINAFINAFYQCFYQKVCREGVCPMDLSNGLSYGFCECFCPMGFVNAFVLWVYQMVCPMGLSNGLSNGLSYGFIKWFVLWIYQMVLLTGTCREGGGCSIAFIKRFAEKVFVPWIL
jgi:hypothetical protein